MAGPFISPSIGTLSASEIRVTDNPIDANEPALAAVIALFLPVAGQQIGNLFTRIKLPSFEGLTVIGVGSGYNVGCAALYLDLVPHP